MTLASVLDTYSLEELCELNDLTPEEVLEFLVREKIIKLPDVQPLDFE